jgi:hypothetical protein
MALIPFHNFHILRNVEWKSKHILMLNPEANEKQDHINDCLCNGFDNERKKIDTN